MNRGHTTRVGLLLIYGDQILMEIFKSSICALTMAVGFILSILSILMVLTKSGHEGDEFGERDISGIAIYPLVVPIMASPMGIVVLTMVSAEKQVTDETIIGLFIAFLAVMAINLGSMLLVDKISKFISLQALQVADRMLGTLLAALVSETVINGLRDVSPKILGA